MSLAKSRYTDTLDVCHWPSHATQRLGVYVTGQVTLHRDLGRMSLAKSCYTETWGICHWPSHATQRLGTYVTGQVTLHRDLGRMSLAKSRYTETWGVCHWPSHATTETLDVCHWPSHATQRLGTYITGQVMLHRDLGRMSLAKSRYTETWGVCHSLAKSRYTETWDVYHWPSHATQTLGTYVIGQVTLHGDLGRMSLAKSRYTETKRGEQITKSF